uniref:P53-like transcription factor n=1 Tax=Ustilago esculenta TaxID=185366 RepID=A0A654JT26_9BASI|nr:P53-like transcription factor [Ustilago esculenta]
MHLAPRLSSASAPADKASFPSMQTSGCSRYKDDAVLVQASPLPPSPQPSPFTADARRLSAQRRSSSSLLLPSPAPALASSRRSTPSGLTTPSHRTETAGLYNWSPILLTPPDSSLGRKRAPSRSGPPDSSAPYQSRSTAYPRFYRSTLCTESPTLATRRAKTIHQLSSGLTSLCVAAGQASSDLRTPTMSSTRASQVSPRSQRDQRHALQASPRTGGSHPHPKNVLPPMKPRALTVDGAERPTLPPVLGYAPQTQVGPIRSSSFSSLRHGADYRSNPYFHSTCARRSVVHTRATPSLSPQTSREASDAEVWSPCHAPWTPTSSVRSTSGSVYHEDVVASSYTLSRTSVSTPFHLDSSPIGPPRLFAQSPTKRENGGTPGVKTAAQLPSPHLFKSSNALGLYLEPAPFPSEMLHLDLGPTAHRGLTPREADILLLSGGIANVSKRQARVAPHMLARSPMPMSDLSSQTPSPSSHSDESLPKLSLGHRRVLDSQNLDPGLPLPALHLHDPRRRAPASIVYRRPPSKNEVDDFLYKMPILRGMSPLDDMSSDSGGEDADEPPVGPSTLADSQSFPANEQQAKKEIKKADVLEEGSTGEIFVRSKAILPLSLAPKEGRSDACDKLYCKLDSTTHQCFSVVDGKWACYRRNYLKVDVSFHFEDAQGRRCDNVHGDLVCSPKDGSPFIVERFAVHMTAHIVNTDGRLQKGRQGLVPLIQFGPARERGPREAVQPVELRAGGSVTQDASANEQAATRSGNIAALRRVQIRSATMNNGQRGSAGQQFYALKLTLLAYPRQAVLSPSAGTELASLVSHPITVRGRSKVHYGAPAATGKRQVNPQVAAGAAERKPSSSKRVCASSSGERAKRSNHAANGGASGQHRRSTRLLLSTSCSLSGESNETIEDADDEGDGDRLGSGTRDCKVMDIRSVL